MSKKQPNIVFILSDDFGYGDANCYGALPEHIKTPNIDSIAEEGVLFTDAHSPSSVCTPSRYNFLTGRYCWRTWAKTGCIWANDPCVIEEEQPTVASVLRDAGYDTGMVGKWHLGFGSPKDPDWDPYRGPDFNKKLTHGPHTCGFNSFFGIPSVGQYPHFFIRGNEVVDIESGDPVTLVPDVRNRFLKKYLDRPRNDNPIINIQGGENTKYVSEELAIQLTEEAISFIEKERKSPFFLYFAHRNVHAPLDPHPRFKGTSPIGDYGDFIHELDWSVGEVIKSLKNQGIYDDTIIIFTSDNGATEYHRPIDFSANYNGHLPNTILRGAKTEVYEGGHRVPFIAKWTNHFPANKRCEHLIALTDMLETLANLVDAPVPQNASPDGIDCSSSFLNPNGKNGMRETLVHDSLFFETYALRHQDWKLILGQGGGGVSDYTDKPLTNSIGQLYNLKDDIREQRNLFESRPAIVNKLTDLYLKIKSDEESKTTSQISL